MVKTPVLLSLALLVAGGILTCMLFAYEEALQLTGADLVSNLLQLWLAVAALISVMFVVSSYIQTNQAFAVAQEPHLLMQVHNTTQIPNEKAPPEQGIHWTGIAYQNITDNPFQDLVIKLSVTDGVRNTNLDDLFLGPMFMAGRDSRTRSFTTVDHLQAHGLDLRAALEKHREVILSVGYRFSFLGKTQEIQAQEYRWDVGQRGWQLR